MEESVNWQFDVYMQEMFHMKEVDIREYSPLTLAYIGDSIYDLIIKSLVINEGNKQVQKLHQETSSLVQASAQSKMMRTLQEILTEENKAEDGKRAAKICGVRLSDGTRQQADCVIVATGGLSYPTTGSTGDG